jgi:hypothetical protein
MTAPLALSLLPRSLMTLVTMPRLRPRSLSASVFTRADKRAVNPDGADPQVFDLVVIQNVNNSLMAGATAHRY